MANDNLTDAEISTLESCQNAADWRRACNAIKDARGGLYPSDWWPRIIASGFAGRVLSRSGTSAKLHAETMQPDGTWKRLF